MLNKKYYYKKHCFSNTGIEQLLYEIYIYISYYKNNILIRIG